MRPSKTGVRGVSLYLKNRAYPYRVQYRGKNYGYFATIEQAQTYLELLQKGISGEGPMPPPVREYKIQQGITVTPEWGRHTEKNAGKSSMASMKTKNRNDSPHRGCKTCKWSGSANNQSMQRADALYCRYIFDEYHHSRLWLHYQRIGREDRTGFTSDKNCTEWEPKSTVEKWGKAPPGARATPESHLLN